MKIKVSEIKPNPFRDMDKYPIDRDKVESLKGSINETGFWDNLVARKNGNGYQIAYGHHRLVVLQELDIKEIDIPVKNLSDVTMLKMMANDNMLQYELNPSVIHETIRAVRNYLDSELAKYKTWEELLSDNKSISGLFNETSKRKSFKQFQDEGIGQTTIVKFLGKGWKQWVVQEALNTLKEKDIDNTIVESLDSMEKIKNFKRSAKKHKLPIEEQKKIADKIKDENIADIDDFIKNEMHIDDSQYYCDKITRCAEDISKTTKSLNTKIAEFNTMAELAGVNTITSEWILTNILSELSDTLGNSERMFGYFGLDFKNKYKELNEKS
jgi:hypothetical protein